MDNINKVWKKLTDKEADFKDKKIFESGTLEDEIINYNRKLYEIIKSNKINFNNEASFMLKIKKQISNEQLLPLVMCFLCDKNYINKLKYESLGTMEIGDIATYALLKTNIEKFHEKLKYIQKNYRFKDCYEWKNTQHFYNLQSLVAETYEKCNCIHINRANDNHKNLYSKDEKYIRGFIYDNLKYKTIDYIIYMKKLAAPREEATQYLIDITKKLLRFNKEEFIKEVEHISDFYNLLEEVLKEEMNREFEIIISNFLQNIIFINK